MRFITQAGMPLRAIVVAVGCAIPGVAMAATFDWEGNTNANWYTGSNWDAGGSGGVPDLIDSAFISTRVVAWPQVNTGGATAEASSISLNAPDFNSEQARLQVLRGTLDVWRSLGVGGQGRGQIEVDLGTNNSPTIFVGVTPPGESTRPRNITVASGGTFLQDGGTVHVLDVGGSNRGRLRVSSGSMDHPAIYRMSSVSAELIVYLLEVGASSETGPSSFEWLAGTIDIQEVIVFSNGVLVSQPPWDAEQELTLDGGEIEARGPIVLKPAGALSVHPTNGGTIRVRGRLMDQMNPDPNVFKNESTFSSQGVAFSNLTVICDLKSDDEESEQQIDFYATGNKTSPDPATGFTTGNFMLKKLVIGADPDPDVTATTAGNLTVRLSGLNNAIYTETLEMRAGATVDFQGKKIYYKNGGTAKQLFLGDADLDGDVDAFDLGIWQTNFEKEGAEWSDGDWNGDRVVDGFDLGIWQTNFGSSGLD